MRRSEMTKPLLAVLIALCALVATARSAELIPLRATYASVGGAAALDRARQRSVQPVRFSGARCLVLAGDR